MLTPSFIIGKDYENDQVVDHSNYRAVLEFCDTVIAVVPPQHLSVWNERFSQLIDADDAEDYADYSSIMLQFDIDQETFVSVSDSGGEYTHGEFEKWCAANNIPCQFVIDSPLCEGITVDEICPGTLDENTELLTLLHKVFN